MNATHPTDEQLSAFLDDEGEDVVVAHVEGCATCRARLDQLRVAIAAVAEPVPPRGGEDRGRDIAFAIATGLTQPAPAPRVASVTPLPSRSRFRPPSWLLPAAAAVVALLLAVPLLAKVGTGGGGAKKASSALTTTSAAAAEAAPAPTFGATDAVGATTTTLGAAAGSPTLAGVSDVGDVSDVAALQQRVRATLATRNGATTATTAKKSTVPKAPAPSCQARADAAAGEGRALTEQLTVRWQGQPAVVFVYTRGPDPLFAAVVASGSCALLVTTTV